MDPTRRGFFKAVAATAAAVALAPILPPAAAAPIAYEFAGPDTDAQAAMYFMISQLCYMESRAFERVYAPMNYAAILDD